MGSLNPARRLLAGVLAGVVLAAAGVLAQLADLGGGAQEVGATAAVPGRILFVHEGDLWVLEGGRARALTQDRGWRQPHGAPDGTQIAAIGVYPNATEIFVLGWDGSDAQQITRNRQRRLPDNEWVFYPRWAPDGQAIAYLSDRTSFYPMLWSMRPDGTGARQLTFPRHGLDGIDSFAWSPDGGQIAATRFAEGVSQIHIMDLPRGASRPITAAEGGAFDPAWSPDGHFLAFVTRQEGQSAISVLELNGGAEPVQLVEATLVRSPQWSPSGTSVAYLALAGRAFEVFVVELRSGSASPMVAGRPEQLTAQFGADAISGLSWVP